MAAKAKIYVGMSGWTYPAWRGSFYPKTVTQKKELNYASRQVTSIEINGTFYSLQKPESFQRWYDEVPENFVFAVKAPRYITHIRRLKDVAEPLSNFLASGVLALKEKLGPILWQFPPTVTLKDDRFEKFLKMLPFESKAAGKLAKKHSDFIEGRAYTKVDGDFRLRHAFEFRHPSFMNKEFIEILRAHNVAVVFAHSGEKCPYVEDLTADFVYARMHGQEKKYQKGYTPATLDWLAERLKLWTAGSEPADAERVADFTPEKVRRDAYVYFDTEAKDYAPKDALNLIKRLSS